MTYDCNVGAFVSAKKAEIDMTAGPKNPFLCPDRRVATGEGRLAQLRRGQRLYSIFADYSVDLWEMMLWLSVSVSCIRYSKRRKFRPKMRQNALLATIGEYLLLKGERRKKRKEGGREGMEGEGRVESHTILAPGRLYKVVQATSHSTQ